MVEVTGIGVSPGRAAGHVVRMPEPVTEPPATITPNSIRGRPADDDRAAAAAEQITIACGRVRDELLARAEKASGEVRAILEASALMAVDPVLVDGAKSRVSGSLSPARAVWDAATEITEMMRALGGRLSERTSDMTDVRDRIVAELSGLPAPGLPDRLGPYVLVARDLAPADAALLDATSCVAVVTASGGATSHTAIVLRSLGLPAVVAAADVLDFGNGAVVLVDGSAGTVRSDPSAAELTRPHTSTTRRVRRFDGRGRTADGHRVALLANIGDPAHVGAAVAAAAEGVGLFRTEFCFLGRPRAPTVDEQVAAYREVLAAFPDQRVYVRTLDVGADKPLPFLAQPNEPNPALGLRGVRLGLRSEQLLADQLAAVAAAAKRERADVWVMAPMVATAEEATDFVARCEAAGLDTAGVMIEVPAAALSAAEILRSARFASIGTNDLTQYTMAADRNATELADLTDPWQPAVLRLVQLTCQAATERDRPVSVCGEAAADPALACVLVGLGVASLSMTPRAIPDVATALRAISFDDCVRVAHLAVAAPSAGRARQTVQSELPELARLDL